MQGRLRKLTALDMGADGALPAEFRIFRPGVNATQSGDDIFDDRAARDVMAAYQEWGVDLIIDLQHDSLDQNARANRADAADARGHFQLELRQTPEGPELWAVNVRWTPDGERRLRERTQRYISPAFRADKKTGRITRLVNVALVSMPATNNTAPLVAASLSDAKRRAACYVRAHQPVRERVEAYLRRAKGA